MRVGNIPKILPLSGPAAKLVDRWSFVQGVDGGWRPGGYNLLAAHAKSGRIYVGMHPDGVEGSHKTPAAEIWALDPKAKKVLTRAPGHNAVALTINQEGEPLLFASGEGMNLLALDPAKEHAFVAELKDSGVQVTVPADKTLLQALQSAGFDVPSDCGEGLCGTCEVAVIDGDVDHRDKVLTRAERATNQRMLACCSRAKGAKVVLAL